MKHSIAFMATLALVLTIIGAGFVHAASDTKNVTLNASVSACATLTLTNTTIGFTVNSSPTTSSTIAGSTTTTVEAQFRNTTATPATLSVAAADLVDGASDTIPITAVHTTAAGTGGGSGFFDTTSRIAWSNSGQQLGTGQSGDYTTTLTYSLDNSWSYKVGSDYTTTATFTLTSL
ncbi:MAG TPA: hypothetical protein VEF34_13035 [Syntrophobacteraceae bacterium]|nr:hypothetical protein [Syntrophobacteraceae bacterium]